MVFSLSSLECLASPAHPLIISLPLEPQERPINLADDSNFLFLWTLRTEGNRNKWGHLPFETNEIFQEIFSIVFLSK